MNFGQASHNYLHANDAFDDLLQNLIKYKRIIGTSINLKMCGGAVVHKDKLSFELNPNYELFNGFGYDCYGPVLRSFRFLDIVNIVNVPKIWFSDAYHHALIANTHKLGFGFHTLLIGILHTSMNNGELRELINCKTEFYSLDWKSDPRDVLNSEDHSGLVLSSIS